MEPRAKHVVFVLQKEPHPFGELNISDYYLELDGNRLEHLSDHIEEDEDVRNIPLTEEQVLLIPEYIDNYDDVLRVVKRKDGSKRIYLGKKINGHSVIIVLASKERNSVQPVTAWQNTTEHYMKVYGNKKTRVDAPRTQAKNAQEESGYKPASSNGTVTPSEAVVNRDPLEDAARAPQQPINDPLFNDIRSRGQNPSIGAADAGFDPFSAAENKYGAIDGKANSVRPDDVPVSVDGVTRVSETVSTIKGAKATPEWFVPVLENATMKGQFSYIPITNNETVQKAIDRIAKYDGFQQALTDWTANVRNGKADADTIVTGQLLYNNAVNSGNTQLALDILVDYQKLGRKFKNGWGSFLCLTIFTIIPTALASRRSFLRVF